MEILDELFSALLRYALFVIFMLFAGAVFVTGILDQVITDLARRLRRGNDGSENLS